MNKPLKEPPSPPHVRSRFRLHRHQLVGIPLIVVLPILGLFRVFGDGIETHRVTDQSLAVEIEYPAKFKFKQTKYVRVKVKNLTGSQLDTVTVELDTSYVSKFSNVSIHPDPQDAYEVILTSLEPQEKREVQMEIEGKNYGTHEGVIRVTGQGTTHRLRVKSIVYW